MNRTRILLSFSLALSLFGLSSSAQAGGALICTSDSSGACAGKQYCCYAGSESEGDKYCKALGCRRGGTSSCPTAANVKSCGTRVASVEPEKPATVQIAWCIEPLSTDTRTL
ncbi:MAG: hypothetical protein JNJ46_30030 [Myxococcales bacterium]|nr:hypothetical protein [Myxococcales bacterium]